MNIQPIHLRSDLITLIPLEQNHFEEMYAVASDPLVWEQHPNKERFKREVFEGFFKGAMESCGAFAVLENETGKIIGSSRFYDYNADNNTVLIGYTFVGRNYWGKKYNTDLKKLMLNHAFGYVEKVIFHIGANNIRSQKAIERLGAVKFDEAAVTYAGEPNANLNFCYKIDKQDWVRMSG